MRTSRLGPRVARTLLFLITVSVPAFAADSVVSGVVVAQSGQALPRAHVRALDSSSREIVAVFADEAGRFRLAVPSIDCRVSASLTGFDDASAPCAAQPMRITLGVAPIRETVVVTATGTEAPADRVGVSVTTFTAEDLAIRQVALVADLLRSSPGVILTRAGGGPGTVTSLFVRGGESNYNKVMLDGIPLNEPGGTFNFSNLTTEQLDRVELLRGAHSALFGSDAMASVVQLFTKRPDRADRKPHPTFAFEGGTYAMLHTQAGVSGATERLDYTFGVTRYDTDNRVPNNEFGNT